jgi:hypothetical protein
VEEHPEKLLIHKNLQDCGNYIEPSYYKRFGYGLPPSQKSYNMTTKFMILTLNFLVQKYGINVPFF